MQKRTHCIIPFIENSRTCKETDRDRKQGNGCLGWGWAQRGEITKEPKEGFGSEMLILLSVVTISQMNPNVKTDQIVQFKYVYLIVYKSYHSNTVAY